MRGAVLIVALGAGVVLALWTVEAGATSGAEEGTSADLQDLRPQGAGPAESITVDEQPVPMRAPERVVDLRTEHERPMSMPDSIGPQARDRDATQQQDFLSSMSF